MDFEEEEEEGVPISEKVLKEVIKKHNLYTTPELNDVLYLHYKGFTSIQNLDPYINLKALWLNNNAISKIEGLSKLVNLKCLYLQNNIIEEIEGLEELHQLDTLSLSHNYISRIQGLAGCTSLSTLELDHNKFKEPQNLVKIVEAPSITILNLTQNVIESEEIAEVLKGLTQLRVLRMDGNQVTRNMPNYRRRLILMFPELRFLDSEPVEPDDRRIAEAWGRGGLEEEKRERQKIREEKDRIHAENMAKFNEMQNRHRRNTEEEKKEESTNEGKIEEINNGDDDSFFVTEQVQEMPEPEVQEIKAVPEIKEVQASSEVEVLPSTETKEEYDETVDID